MVFIEEIPGGKFRFFVTRDGKRTGELCTPYTHEEDASIYCPDAPTDWHEYRPGETAKTYFQAYDRPGIG